MQLAVAAYFVIGPLISLSLQLVFRDDYRRLAVVQVAKSLRANPNASGLDANQLADFSLTFALVVGVIFGILYLVLAALVAAKPRPWVFWVAFVLLALQSIGLLITAINLVLPEPNVPRAAAAVGSVIGLFAAGIFAWMIVGLTRYGPWALEKVPAAL